MRAMVYTEYGPPEVLELRDVEEPAPRADEVLVRVHAASVNYGDWGLLRGKPFLVRLMAGGPLRPKHRILGADLAGRVEAVGRRVGQFQPGDEVFGDIGAHGFGAFAEYVAVPENSLAPKPSNMRFDQAAAVPQAAVVALHALRDQGQVRPGHRVLINGASGGVGTFAVQIAKSMGARVIGVCSTRNLDLVRSIGADQVIDYTQEDLTQNGDHYDLIFDAVAKRSFSECKRALKPQGVYITTEFSPLLALRGMWASMTESLRMAPLPPKPPSRTDLVFVQELLQAGKVTPVIDRRYPLGELPEALRYLEKGHARGKVIVTVLDVH